MGTFSVAQGYDLATFTGGLQIRGFPFEVCSDQQATNWSGFALGPESSSLKSLVDAGLAPSTAMGIFFGSRSENQPTDGNIIFGGYDQARVNGSFVDFPIWNQYLNTPCPLQVLIQDVQLNYINGSHSSLLADPESVIPAYIDP